MGRDGRGDGSLTSTSVWGAGKERGEGIGERGSREQAWLPVNFDSRKGEGWEWGDDRVRWYELLTSPLLGKRERGAREE